MTDSSEFSQFCIPIVHGKKQFFKSVVYQGHACAVTAPGEIKQVMDYLRITNGFNNKNNNNNSISNELIAMPCAFRVSTVRANTFKEQKLIRSCSRRLSHGNYSGHPEDRKNFEEKSEEYEPKGFGLLSDFVLAASPHLSPPYNQSARADDLDIDLLQTQVRDMPVVIEDCQDNSECGGGEKIMHLLRRWDIQNMLLVVTRKEVGTAGTQRLGGKRFKVMMDCAQQVLEQCYSQAIEEEREQQEYEVAAIVGNQEENHEDLEVVESRTTSGTKSKLESKHAETAAYTRGKGNRERLPMGIGQFKVPPLRSTPARKLLPDNRLRSLDTFSADRQEIMTPIKSGRGNQSPKAEHNANNFFVSRTDCDELRAMLRPPIGVFRIIQCVGMLLNHHDLSWAGLRQLIGSRGFRQHLCMPLARNGQPCVELQNIQRVRVFLETEQGSFHLDRVRQLSPPASRVLEWVFSVVETKKPAVEIYTTNQVLF